jgi:HAMP domain-containing protein
MSPLLVARLVLLLAGIALFVMSVRSGQDAYRYAAMAVLVVAVILRFVDRRQQRGP